MFQVSLWSRDRIWWVPRHLPPSNFKLWSDHLCSSEKVMIIHEKRKNRNFSGAFGEVSSSEDRPAVRVETSDFAVVRYLFSFNTLVWRSKLNVPCYCSHFAYTWSIEKRLKTNVFSKKTCTSQLGYPVLSTITDCWGQLRDWDTITTWLLPRWQSWRMYLKIMIRLLLNINMIMKHFIHIWIVFFSHRLCWWLGNRSYRSYGLTAIMLVWYI